jgi:hypothetical protein
MAEDKEKARFGRKEVREERAEPVAESSWLEKKIKAINESAMPEAQKKALLKEIGAIHDESADGKIPFNVYARIRKIEIGRQKAMMAYPKARLKNMNSLEEWDQIFKEF